jgi:hypothetical protein
MEMDNTQSGSEKSILQQNSNNIIFTGEFPVYPQNGNYFPLDY